MYKNLPNLRYKRYIRYLRYIRYKRHKIHKIHKIDNFECFSGVVWVPRRPTIFGIHPQVDLDVGNPFFMVWELENHCCR